MGLEKKSNGLCKLNRFFIIQKGCLMWLSALQTTKNIIPKYFNIYIDKFFNSCYNIYIKKERGIKKW